MSPWATFYAGRDSASYLEYAKLRYAPFIDAIASRIEHQATVLELGAGTGTITAALQWRGRKAYFITTDIDDDQLATLDKRFAETPAVSVGKLNAMSPWGPYADVVHSHGMLEHFDDARIQRVISNWKSRSRFQVHYVPGLYPSPTFGDERLMSVDAWWKICKPSQIITFNDGLDYALVFE